ncbi:TraR/DksA family transcriptional regulator [Microvenator marinus]|jgi:DnaK suppressor protein|uniref:TraR/DksA family transcriptional regulator n=1 Tax=Microvenator marinus TaxID=2600177 RepID=A0A5B8XVU5_9DELT|nr:TraR/DksA C4-type zinc finger protein [Microvenator marinus]QED29048.1 TraR/DksA family transcriptional regulator [Microvenator marinus]
MLSDEFLKEMEGKLLERRAALVKRQLNAQNELIEIQASDAGIRDSLDTTGLEQESAQAMIMRERERKELLEIDEALRRIEQGEYGVCEATGEPLSEKRLRVNPLARLTVEAQEDLEREEKRRNFRPGLLDDM